MGKILIPNTTQVPNILLDVVMPAIKNAPLRVLLAIVRKTYGFQKGTDKISITQLQKLTGLSRQGVVDGIAGLGNILTVKSTDRGINEYSLNLNISTGDLVNQFDQSSNLTSQVSSRKVVNVVDTQNQYTKPKKPPFSSTIENVIGRINELSGRAYRTDSKAILKYLRARLKAGVTEADCLAVVDDRWAKWRDNEKMKEHFNPVTLFREENFARYLEEARANGAAKTKDNAQSRKEMFVNA